MTVLVTVSSKTQTLLAYIITVFSENDQQFAEGKLSFGLV
jgi:hypothetical protein